MESAGAEPISKQQCQAPDHNAVVPSHRTYDPAYQAGTWLVTHGPRGRDTVLREASNRQTQVGRRAGAPPRHRIADSLQEWRFSARIGEAYWDTVLSVRIPRQEARFLQSGAEEQTHKHQANENDQG